MSLSKPLGLNTVRPLTGVGNSDIGFTPGGPATSQYDKGTTILDRADPNAARSRNQPWYDELGNMGMQIMTTVGGQMVSAFGSITDGIFNLISSKDIAPNEGLSGIGQDIVEWGANEHPIYWDPKEGTFLNGSYLASRIPSVASTLSMLIPGMGVARAVGGAARLLRLGSNIEKVATMAGGAVAMRHAENWMESGQVYSELKKDLMMGENNTGGNPLGTMLTEEEADAAAKSGSSLTYRMNWANIGFDMLQLGLVMKPITGLFGRQLGATSKLGSTLDYGSKVTAARGLMAGAGKWEKALLRGIDIAKPFAGQLTEGIEEVVNQVSQYEGIRKGSIEAGTQIDDGSTVMQRVMNDYLGRWETKDAFAWGMIGGTAFQMAGGAIASAQNKNGFWNNVTGQAERIAAIKKREEVVSNYSKVLQDPASTKYDKEVAKSDLIFNLVQNNRQSDTLDMLMADMQNPKAVEELAKVMGDNAQDFTAGVPQILEDMKWIRDSIDEYEGGSWNSVFWGNRTKQGTDVSLDPDQKDMQAFKSAGVGVGSYADPKLSMQLAYNDYSMKVRDRINKAAAEDIATNVQALYGSENLSPNASMFLNLDSDLRALNSAKNEYALERSDMLKQMADAGVTLSKATLDMHDKIIERYTDLIAKKTKEQEKVLQSIEENLKDATITTETPLAKIKALQANQEHALKIISKKNVYFVNQSEKQATMDVNARILKDPKAFEREQIEDSKKLAKFTQAQAEEMAAKQAAQKEGNDLVAALYTSPDFDAAYKEATKEITAHMSTRNADNKQSYLRAELGHIEKLIREAIKSGDFDNSSATAFNTKFNKEKFIALQAKHKALTDMLPKNTTSTNTPGKAPAKTNKTGSKAYKAYDEGTPPRTYFDFRSANSKLKMYVVARQQEGKLFDLAMLEERVAAATAANEQIIRLLGNLETVGSQSEEEAIYDQIADIIKPFNVGEDYKKTDTFAEKKENMRLGGTANPDPATAGRDPMSYTSPIEIFRGFLESSQEYLAALDLPAADNPYLLTFSDVFTTELTDTSLFQKFFNESFAGVTLREFFDKQNESFEILDNEEDRLKEEADQFIAKGPGSAVKSKPGDPIPTEDDMELSLASSKETRSIAPNRETFTSTKNPRTRAALPSSNEQHVHTVAPYVMEKDAGFDAFGNENPAEVKRDALGRLIPNVIAGDKGYKTWSAHHLDGSKPGKGFIKAGDTVTLEYVMEGKYPTIRIFKDGIYAGVMDSSDRTKKSLASAQAALAAIKDKVKQKRSYETLKRNIQLYKDLIPVYEQLEAKMAAAKGPMQITVKKKVTASGSPNVSGGVFWGTLNTIPVTTTASGVEAVKPISMKDAHGPTINTEGSVIMANFYNGKFWVEQNGNMVDVTSKFPGIVIPQSLVSELTKSPDKNLNSQIFQLTPTHTLTDDNKHIYTVNRAYTLDLNDSRVSANGKDKGPTLAEAIFDAMMNPDKDARAFESLVKAAKLEALYSPGLKIDQQSAKFKMAFYSTKTLLDILNKVTYVYDGKVVFSSKNKTGDYSKHIGLDVFMPKGSEMTDDQQLEYDKRRKAGVPLTEDEKKMGFPYLRMDLSNDKQVRNTYVIRLFDENGNFKPAFGETTIQKGKLLPADQRDVVDPQTGFPQGMTPVTVDVLTEIKKRFNQKKFRIDKKEISKPITESAYSGFSFDGGRLVIKDYDNYIDYVSAPGQRFIESTIYGLKVKTTDGKTAMSYYTNRGLWFEDDLREVGKEAKPTKTGKAKKVRVNTKPTKKSSKGPLLATNVPALLQKSIELGKTGKVTKTKKEYKISGLGTYKRVSSVIGSTYSDAGGGTAATLAGDQVDAFGKDFFETGVVGTPESYNMTQEAWTAINNFLTDIKKGFVNGEAVVGAGVTLFHTFPDGTKIAGEADLITIDQNNVVRIYDFKTSSDVFGDAAIDDKKTGNGVTRSKREQFHLQLSVYAKLVEGMTGLEVANLTILPVTLAYSTSGKSVNITAAIPYAPIALPGLAPDLDTYVPSLEVEEEVDETEAIPDIDDIPIDEDEETGIGGRSKNSHMSDFSQPVDTVYPETVSQMVRLVYQDPARMRNYSESMSFQNDAEDFVGDLITKVMFDRRVVDKDTTSIDRDDLKKQIRNTIKDMISKRNAWVASGFKRARVKGELNTFKLSDGEKSAYKAQSQDLEKILRDFDWAEMSEDARDASKNFVGYFTMAAMNANANKLINVEFEDSADDTGEENDDDTNDDDAISYATRFVKNYSFKINPKATISIETKVLLTQMRVLERNGQGDSLTFTQVYNRFGAPKHYPLNNIMDELLIDFEGTSYSEFLDTLRVISDRSPLVHSMFQTFERLSKGSEDKENQYITQLSTFIKQRRDMLTITVNREDQANPTVRLFNAERQGVKENIIQQWQTKFKDQFPRLFDLITTKDAEGNEEYDATPKTQQPKFQTKGDVFLDLGMQLPDDWSGEEYSNNRMFTYIFNSIATALEKGGKVRLNMTFNKDTNLTIGKTVTDITFSDVLAIATMFDLDNFIMPVAFKDLIASTRGSFALANTKIEQISNTLKFLIRNRGDYEGEGGLKSYQGYSTSVYKMMAIQLEKLGIQMAEDKEMSYVVLEDLNSPFKENGRFMKFHIYDKRATDFGDFLIDKIEELTIKPLVAKNAFKVTKKFTDEGTDGDVSTAALDINEPLQRARRGLDALASHARSEWISYANSTIRNAAGDLEFTYNAHNTLSLLMNKLRNPETGFLADLLETPFGQHNMFIQSLGKEGAELSNILRLKYIDGGVVDKYGRVSPENITTGIENMIGWNSYFNDERPGSTNRNNGYYITTHGESTVMPAFEFEKNIIALEMEEYEDASGTLQYKMRLPKTNETGGPNIAYRKMYGVIRGELERVAQGFRIYKDIVTGRPLAEQLSYAYDQGYKQGIHFKTGLNSEGNTIVTGPGTSTNFYFLGSNMFKDEKTVTGFYNNNRTDLDAAIVDNEGSVWQGDDGDATAVQNVIDKVIQGVVNELTYDAYAGMTALEDSFFETDEKNRADMSNSKRRSVRLGYGYLNKASVDSVKKLFEENTVIVREGQRLTTDSLNDRIEATYSTEWLSNRDNIPYMIALMDSEAAANVMAMSGLFDTMSEEDFKALQERFEKDRDAVRGEDRKKASKPYAQLKYMVAERSINEFIFRTSLYQIAYDPAAVGKSNNFMDFWYDFTKRNTVMLAPGNGSLGQHPVSILGYKDHRLGSVYKEYSSEEMANLDPLEQEYMALFKAEHPDLVNGNSYPIRVSQQASMYYAIPPENTTERKHFLKKLARKNLGIETTDAGSYISAREFAYRLKEEGYISANDYFELVDHFYNGARVSPALMKQIKIGVSKYVGAGPNFLEFESGEVALDTMKVKHAEFPLLRGITVRPGDPLYDIALHAETREREINKFFSPKEVVGGVVLAAPTAVKLGFSSDASLYDENGKATDQILSVRPMIMDREFYRKQIESSSKDLSRGTMSVQGNKFKSLNIPGNWRFGRSGPITFSRKKQTRKDAIDVQYYDSMHLDADDANDGVSANQMETMQYMLNRQLAILRMRELANTMGFTLDDKKLTYEIQDVEKFIERIAQHAVDQYGMASNSAAFLATLSEKDRLAWPITFATNSRNFQTIILAEMQKIFFKFTLPGGAYAQVSATGLQGNDQLANYKIVSITKTFADMAAVNAALNKEEIESLKENKDNTVTVKYKEHKPGEAMIVWNFRDERGKMLPYDQFVDEDGYIKNIEVTDEKGNKTTVPAISDDMLHIIVNRIPNTGVNTMSRLKAVRFFKPDVKDAIAMAPEIVAMYNADFDYDKLFTYVYNGRVDEFGRLVKVPSVIHHTQNGVSNQLNSESARRSFARAQLLKDNRQYAKLSRLVREAEERLRENESVVNNTDSNIRNIEGILVSNENEIADYAREMNTMETEFMTSDVFVTDFENGNIYSRQNERQLENGLIDIYHVTLSDFKMLRGTTEFLTADWLHGQIKREVTMPDGSTPTIEDLYEGSKYFNIGSWWTNSQTRVASADAAKAVGIFANVLTSLSIAQRNGLSYNAAWGDFSDSDENVKYYTANSALDVWQMQEKGIKPSDLVAPDTNPAWMYAIGFLDNNGRVKTDMNEDDKTDLGNNTMTDDNRPYRHAGKPMNAYYAQSAKGKKDVYRYLMDARGRYDRIYTINNKGERVNISSVIQATLQAFLDYKNNPVRGYLNINSKTSNALMNMLFLGYVDEAPLILMQESVVRYVNKVNRKTDINSAEQISYVDKQLETISEITGIKYAELDRRYKYLKGSKGMHNMNFFLIQVIKEQMGINNRLSSELSLKDLSLDEARLSTMMGTAVVPDAKDKQYAIDQLKAFRLFLLADQYGNDIFRLQQATNADSKGAGKSFVEMQVRRDAFNNLFDLTKKGKLKSSVPTLAGVHRLSPVWSQQLLNEKGSSRRARWVPGSPFFTYMHGIKPIFDLLKSNATSNIFYEFTPLFLKMQDEYEKVSGKTIDKLGTKEQIRIRQKLNLNFVSYIFSNPSLFRGMFPTGEAGDAEFEYFKEHGTRHLTKPDSSLPAESGFTIFNDLESTQTTFKRVSDMDFIDPETKDVVPYRTEYEVLNALTPIANTTKDNPSALILPASIRFQGSLSSRLPTSMAAMWDSKDPVLQKLIKKMVLHAYATGGVIRPNSYIQHLPAHLLTNFGISNGLYTLLQTLDRYAVNDETTGLRVSKETSGAIQNFVVQYLQHNKFEMKNNVDGANLMKFKEVDKDGAVGFTETPYNDEFGRRAITFHKGKEPQKTYLVKYANTYWRRVVGKDAKTYFVEIDNAGNGYANEYKFSSTIQPVLSIIKRNESLQSKGYNAGVTEVNNTMSAGEGDSELDEELEVLAAEAAIPFAKKLDGYVRSGQTVLAHTFMRGMRLEDFTLSGAVMKRMETIANNAKTPVKFINDPKGPFRQSFNREFNGVIINIGHPKYQFGGDFDQQTFADDFAHEIGHVGINEGITEFYEDEAGLQDTNPELYQAVLRLDKLKDVILKAVKQNKKLGFSEDFAKWQAIVEKTNSGKALEPAEVAFGNRFNHFRGLLDTDANLESFSNKREGQLHEFGTYAYGNADFQRMLNAIVFQEGDKATPTTFWEKVKEVLAEIIEFFGFGKQEDADKEIANIKKRFKPAINTASKDARGILSQDNKTGAVPASIAEIRAFSGLHVALKNLMVITREAEASNRNMNFSSKVESASSNMSDFEYLTEEQRIDKIYEGVKNYDKSWPENIKVLYNEAAKNGDIIC